MLLYRSPNSSLTTFLNSLQNFLNTGQVVDIILVDFNINVLNSANDNTQHVFSHYMLIVSEPVHISGLLIGHVYINNNLMQKILAEKTEIISVYFSDHDAVKFTLENMC